MKKTFVVFLCLLLFACGKESPPEEKKAPTPAPEAAAPVKPTLKSVSLDLDAIRKRGTLVALTRFNANSYFLYRGQPMGYEYELLSRLAEHLGVRLEIKVPQKWDDLVPLLYRGKGDIIAANMTVTTGRSEKLQFTRHHTSTRQVLVQKKPENWRKMTRDAIDKKLIRNQHDLIGKKVHVRKGSSYEHRLKNLSEEIGGGIDVVFAGGDLETEALIKQVADGTIEYTVADENIALINQSYHPDLDVKTPVSFPQRIAWAVRPNAPKLLKAVNTWLQQMKTSREPTYYVIYNKYYKNKRLFKKRLKSNFFTTKTGKISPYDNLIQKYAQTINWDWKLLAAQIYQESQFDPKEKSWAGARGLMQVMPKTGKEFGITKLYDPEENLKAGTRLLAWLTDYWKEIPDEDERLKFILASYNAGQGHVQDARRLAQKLGKNPDIWDGNVAESILKKAQKKYYTDEVVRFGYCRGEEPYNYVQEILYTYGQYSRFIK